jgi:hypothetical protein
MTNGGGKATAGQGTTMAMRPIIEYGLSIVSGQQYYFLIPSNGMAHYFTTVAYSEFKTDPVDKPVFFKQYFAFVGHQRYLHKAEINLYAHLAQRSFKSYLLCSWYIGNSGCCCHQSGDQSVCLPISLQITGLVVCDSELCFSNIATKTYFNSAEINAACLDETIQTV